MTTRAEDIEVFLSVGKDGEEGELNTLPENSLGGPISGTRIATGLLNNLFDDVTPEEVERAESDYRCIYFYHKGDTIIYNVKIWIETQAEGGATIQLGIDNATPTINGFEGVIEVQRIILDSLPDSGFLEIAFEGEDLTVNWEGSAVQFASDLQNELNNLMVSGELLLKNVVVIVDDSGLVYDIQFTGQDRSRSYEEIEIPNNQLKDEDDETIGVDVTTLIYGAPINLEAQDIYPETVVPSGIIFVETNYNRPIYLPKLKPLETFYLWLHRYTIANEEPVENDGITLRFKASSLDPLKE